ncbi:HORMA domain-containing protein [Pavlovales sp. CCMP2436]|nr:HORMA domain-containing protein [Pavlovales sp. CCMP2436]
MRAQMVRPVVEQQLSMQQCTVVMDGVLLMAISNVCFARGLFPPGDFDSRPMGVDLPVQRRLKENDRTAGLLRWLREGVSPALEKRYLDKVLLLLTADKEGAKGARIRRQPARPLLPLNHYVFSFQCEYNDLPVLTDRQLRSKEGIVQQASAMLSLLGAYTESFAPLQCQEAFVRIELVYNSSTPEGYTPGSLFTARHETAGHELDFVDKAAELDVRNVKTPHQSLSTKLYTTSVAGMWEEAAMVRGGKLAVGAHHHRVGAPRGAPGKAQKGTSSPTFAQQAAPPDSPSGSQLSQGSREASKAVLLSLYADAKAYCDGLGAGAVVNAASLQTNVFGMKALDACMVLCRLESNKVVSGLHHEQGGRLVLAPPASDAMQ